MTLRRLLQTTVAGTAALALLAGIAAPTVAVANPLKIVFLANTDDEDYDGSLVFKDYVEAVSNGEVTVEIYPGGQLCGNPDECLEALQGGIIEIFITTFGGFGNIVPEAQVMDMPYIFPNDRVAECALSNESDFFRLIRDRTLDQTGNMRLMTISNTGGWRNFATTRKQIRTPADVSGLKIRTIGSEVQQELVRSMGGAPTSIAWPEVYTSLATGIVEGTKNGITDIVGMKFHEHLKYMTLDGHAYMGAMWMMNNDALMALTPEQRKIVDDGFDALRWTAVVMPKRRQIEAYQAFNDAGGEIYVPTPEEKAQFVEISAPIYDWYTETYGSEWLDVLKGSIAECEERIAATQADFLN
jgi:TRAP-type transport system periplasmic protein